MPTCNDSVFTPVSDCRFFDFTLRFSNVIFAILPSCIAILLFVARLVRLRHKPDIDAISHFPRLSLLRFCSLHSDPISLIGASVFIINAVLTLVLIIILASPSSSTFRHAMDQSTALPSFILVFLASVLAVPLSVAERRKTRGGSMLLPLWLFLLLLFNACRIRTFNAVAAVRGSSLFNIYLVDFGCLALMLMIENARSLHSAQHNSTHESRAGFFSRLLFAWVFPLLWSGFRKPLELVDLQALKTEFYGQALANDFIAAWTGISTESRSRGPASEKHSFDVKINSDNTAGVPESDIYPLEKLRSSRDNDHLTAPANHRRMFPKRVVKRRLLSATLRAFPRSALVPVPWKLLLTACQLAQPFLVSTTLAFVQSYSDGDKGQAQVTAQPAVYGWGLVGAYAFVYLGMALAEGQYWHTTSQVMTKVRGAYVEAIYRKGLDLHVRVARTCGGGKAANLMSVDTERIVEAGDIIHEIWSGCITLAVGVYLLYAQLGLVFLASILSVAICFLLTPIASRGMGTKQGVWSAATDKRVDLTSSIMSDIKGVKLSAYEDVLHAKVCRARAKELSARSALMKQATGVITFTNTAGEMLGFFTFITLIIVDKLTGSNRFDTNTVFTTLTIFQLIRDPLFQLGQQYTSLLQAWSSMNRIEAFLASEAKPDVQGAVGRGLARCSVSTASNVQAPAYAAIFTNASLGWAEENVLSEVNIAIPAGTLTMICGQLGQGKSTLLQALLGECDLLAGEQQLPFLAKRVAYVSQDIWLQETCSIRDNIVFATGEYDEERYVEALRACALTEDIAGLQNGDQTHANALSGGQRQRVAVARAVYSCAEAYIFDDITSALDAETAAHMWRALMGPAGLLKGKTVIMATNDVHLLHHAQLVIRVDAGKIAESGRYETLTFKGKMAISHISQASQQTPANAASDEPVQLNPIEEQEDVLTGSVEWKAYATWLNAAGRGRTVLFTAFFALMIGTLLGSSYYLQAWARSQQEHRFRHWVAWAVGYLCLPPTSAAFLAIAFWILCVNCAELAGNRLHDAELKAVLSAPLTFFSVWNTGQVTNRFSQDLYHIDQTFVFAVLNTVGVVMLLLGSLITMIVATPYLAILVVVLFACSWAIQRIYLPSSRQLRRLEMATKSPLYSIFAETSVPAGLATVRALQRDTALLERNTALLDISQRPYYHLFTVRRWLQVWLLLLTMITNVTLVLLAVVLRHSSRAGLLGVALVQATLLGSALNQTVVNLTEVEIAGVALERVREFSLLEPEEQSVAVEHTPSAAEIDETAIQGNISFNNVSVSYSADLEPAFRGLSFELSAGRRLGIVGRSGSGKSTVLPAMFRMISMRAGAILLDGSDISQIPLRKLRSAMTIIPQTPLLLAASIRENLDPDLTCKDDELWSALHTCHLTEFVKKQPNQLEELLLTGETYISMGQRQLLALARALLRKKKILVLDEATSAMDVETEKVVRDVLATHFADCTVIAVAHRIATIIGFDHIICMSNGQLIESGTPLELLEARGEFWALAAEQRCI